MTLLTLLPMFASLANYAGFFILCEESIPFLFIGLHYRVIYLLQAKRKQLQSKHIFVYSPGKLNIITYISQNSIESIICNGQNEINK